MLYILFFYEGKLYFMYKMYPLYEIFESNTILVMNAYAVYHLLSFTGSQLSSVMATRSVVPKESKKAIIKNKIELGIAHVSFRVLDAIFHKNR